MSPEKKWDLGDYVDVPERMAWFFEHFPNGSLQAEVLVGPETGSPVITVKAYAYREPLDDHPGTGLASEVYPGTTPYTKGSELMNAETSAWGRALAAIGAPTRGHIASQEEVKGAEARRKEPKPKAEPEQPTLPADHQHTWVQSPTLKKFHVCSDPACRKVERKPEEVETTNV